jgi:hypothetical protein
MEPKRLTLEPKRQTLEAKRVSKGVPPDRQKCE